MMMIAHGVIAGAWSFLVGVLDFTFTRAGDQYGIDSGGDLVKSTANNAAFIDGEGILLEGARTNLFLNSFVPATQTVTVAAVPHTITVKGTGDITVSGVGAGVATEGSPLTLTPTAGGLICTLNGSLDNVNLEAAAFGSSFIETAGASASRSLTSMTRVWPFPANDFSGQIKVRPQFEHDDTKGVARLLYLSDGTADNRISISYTTADDRIDMFKTLSAGSSAGPTTVLNNLLYSKGDLLNIRFRQDAVGLHMWVNSETKISTTVGNSPDSFTVLMDQIDIGFETPIAGRNAFQTVESFRVWNEAKSDSFMENLT